MRNGMGWSRAKRTDNGKWIEGYLYEHLPPIQCFAPEVPEESKWYILNTAWADWHLPRQVDFVEIDPKTAGMFTGLLDKNKKKIWEHDIVSGDWGGEEVRFMIAWDEEKGAMMMIPFSEFTNNGQKVWKCYFAHDEANRREVVGNIYDNPELKV